MGSCSSHCKWALRWWLELERDSWLCSAAKDHIVNVVDFHPLFLLPTELPSFLTDHMSLSVLLLLILFCGFMGFGQQKKDPMSTSVL